MSVTGGFPWREIFFENIREIRNENPTHGDLTVTKKTTSNMQFPNTKKINFPFRKIQIKKS
jgi:hypothetical protein